MQQWSQLPESWAKRIPCRENDHHLRCEKLGCLWCALDPPSRSQHQCSALRSLSEGATTRDCTLPARKSAPKTATGKITETKLLETSANIIDKTTDTLIVQRACHSVGATTMKFILNGANAVDSFVMRSLVNWKMAVPPDNTKLAYNFLRLSTSHFVKKEAPWIRWPLTFAGATLQRNGNVWRQQ